MSTKGTMFSPPMARAILDGRKTKTRRLITDTVPEPPSMDNWLKARRTVAGSVPIEAPRHPAPYLDAYCGGALSKLNPRGMTDRWCWWTRDDRQSLPTFKVGHKPGDTLWMRETLRWDWTTERWRYDADGADVLATVGSTLQKASIDRWPLGVCSSMFMPRDVSRATLTITDVKVERLHEITDADCLSEGIYSHDVPGLGTLYSYDVAGVTGAGCRSKTASPGGWSTPRGAFMSLWEKLHGQNSWFSNPYVSVITFSVTKRVAAGSEPAQEQRSTEPA